MGQQNCEKLEIPPEKREAPARLHTRRGYNIRRYTPIQPGAEELLLSSSKVHPPVVRF